MEHVSLRTCVISKMRDESIIQWTDQMIKDAIVQCASDIHIEPYTHNYRIRYRCEGVLIEKTCIQQEMANHLITLLKVMSKLNIAEKRLPQDGHLNAHGM